MAWQLQQAKQHFSEVVRKALDEGPQVVTRRGDEAVVVISAQEYHRLARPDLARFLLHAPGPDLSELELERDAVRPPDLPRDVEL